MKAMLPRQFVIRTISFTSRIFSTSECTSVIVVGGGLVGCSNVLFLAQHGVKTILLEKHAASSPHPRAIGFTTRSMEIFRNAGLGSKIPIAPKDFKLRRAKIESLSGKWFDDTAPWTPPKQNQKESHIHSVSYSPTGPAAIAQDTLEPILKQRAQELGADVRFSHELIKFDQDEKGVTVWVRQRDTGREYSIRASYLIAADGHRSAIREALNIQRTGRGYLQTVRSVLFRAPLDEYLK